MVLHPKTEPIRALIKQLDEAPVFAKGPYAKELANQTLTLLSEAMHVIDKLEQRVAALERFPELRTGAGS